MRVSNISGHAAFVWFNIANILRRAQPPRTCTYAWQAFTDITSDNVQVFRHETCLFDSACRPLASEHDLAQPFQNALKPLYHFATASIPALRGDDVVVTEYQPISTFFAPVLRWNGGTFGGVSGCRCGDKMADKGRGGWVSWCTFANVERL